MLPCLLAMLLLVLLCLASLPLCPSLAQLSPSFYSSSCPNLVSTVSNTFSTISKQDNVVPPSTLRLILHDCFVEGCDASILIDSTSSNQAERDAPDNANLPQNAFNAIIKTKQAVENICPGVVSCADILALAAKEAVVFLGGPTWDVPLGRRDGTVSQASMVAGRLPGAGFNVKQLVDNFGAEGLSVDDMVILSGAHTIGFSHCDQFSNRLYNFNSSVKVDPSIDPTFLKQLQQKCPQQGNNNVQPLDVSTPFVFDNLYYKDLQAGKGLLFSDQVLFQDPSTQSIVNSLAVNQGQFFQSFVASMIKLTSVGVKLGTNGEIRKDCTAFNNPSSSNTPTVTPTIGTPTVATPSAPPPVNVPPSTTPPVTTPILPSSPPPVTPILPSTPPPVIPPPSPVIPPPPVIIPPSPVIRPPSPVIIPPSPVIPPPSPNVIIPPPTLPPPTPSPPPPPAPIIPPPSTSAPSVPTFNPTPPSKPVFTIPGIPGLTPPISIPGVPGFRIPGFGRPPPGSPGGNQKSPSSGNRASPGSRK